MNINNVLSFGLAQFFQSSHLSAQSLKICIADKTGSSNKNDFWLGFVRFKYVKECIRDE